MYVSGPSMIAGAAGPGDLRFAPFTPLPEADRGRFHVISGGIDNGIVIRSNGTYQRYSKLNGALLDELPGGSFGGDGDRYADAFDPVGEYFYYYDGQSKQIYKCRTWW